MILIVAEKKDFAKKISDVLGDGVEKQGYFETGIHHITWTWGHVLALKEPEDYDDKYKEWHIDDLPILPDPFLYKPIKDNKQLSVIGRLLKKGYDEVICATDAEREGELIFRLVYNYFNIKIPTTRMWCDTTNKEGILKAYQNRKPLSHYDGYYYEADSREKADWLIGINLSRLYSKKFDYTLPIGRVMTPTLSLIANRESEIENFVPKDIFTLKGQKDDLIFKKEVSSDEELDKFGEISEFTILEINKKTKKIKAPTLFRLSTCQEEANKLFGYSLKTTLDTIQSLYQKGLVSYPRTNSCYLPEDMEDEFRQIIFSLLPYFPDVTQDRIDVKKVLNNKKIDAHYAIIVLSSKDQILPEQEENIFNMIKTRMMASVMEDFVYEETEVLLNDDFKGTLKSAVTQGFNDVLHLYDYHDRCTFSVSDTFSCQLEKVKSKSKPPKHYTDATIVKAMENLKDQEHDYVGGIGTPATRDSIIEKLIQYDYITRKNKNLLIAEKGKYLNKFLSGQLKSIDLTANLEKVLNNVRIFKTTPEEFFTYIKRYVENEIERVKKMEKILPTIARCPFCHSLIRKDRSKYFCENPDCCFEIWEQNKFLKSLGLKKVTDTFVKNFCTPKGVLLKKIPSKKKPGVFFSAYVKPIKKTFNNNSCLGFDLEYCKKGAGK